MVQLWKSKKKVVQTNEEVKAIKEKIIELFCTNKIICENFKLYEDNYMQLINNDNVAKLFADVELINTAELFFANNLNISLTSKAGYMHRNTLIYRLDKIKALVGLDIRNFNDAVVFQHLIVLHKFECK